MNLELFHRYCVSSSEAIAFLAVILVQTGRNCMFRPHRELYP
jgi:hypothetical protein